MGLFADMPIREDDTVKCIGMDNRYNRESLLTVGREYQVEYVTMQASLDSRNAENPTQVQWIYIRSNRGRWNYEAKHFQLVHRPYNNNDVLDCVQDFIKTVPKKEKTCHQAILQTKNSTS